MGSISIRQAASSEDLASTAKCFDAYVEWLAVDISFQNYNTELEGLPGRYAPPTGALLLAIDDITNETLGCIALRPISLDRDYQRASQRELRYCEIKRLFVYPAARGRQVARRLIKEVLKVAEEQGFDEILLDTLARMAPAISLYESEGFVQTNPYYYNPLEGVRYYRKQIKLRD